MAFAVIGLGLAFFFLALQWYVGKKADEEEARFKNTVADQRSIARRGKVRRAERNPDGCSGPEHR